MSDEIKKIMTGGSKSSEEMSPEIKEKLNELKDTVMEAINKLKEEGNKIPFAKLHELTQLDYALISDIILALIMEKRLLGFINDFGTDAYDDDILILRDKRLVDDLEPEYETGYT